MSLLFILIIIVFLAGIYFVAMYDTKTATEAFTVAPRCPNMLIQKGSRFYLYNSNLAEVPGVNPIEFENLENYVEFIDWQRSQGIRCPVLYLQQSYDAQGQEVYKVRPSVTEPQGGLPPAPSTTTIMSNPSVDNTITGVGNVMGPDSTVDAGNTVMGPGNTAVGGGNTIWADNTMRGSNTMNTNANANTQKIRPTSCKEATENTENLLFSPNPMDDNWGGQRYTQQLVDAGCYVGNEVSLYVP